jgi:hypothetical protein
MRRVSHTLDPLIRARVGQKLVREAREYTSISNGMTGQRLNGRSSAGSQEELGVLLCSSTVTGVLSGANTSLEPRILQMQAPLATGIWPVALQP